MSAFRIAPAETAFALSRGSKRPRQTDNKHLEWIRTLPCLVTGRKPVDAAHIRYGDLTYGKRETGRSEKPSDKYVVPLCRTEHAKQHSMNERDYWAAVGLDPLKVALALYANSGDDEAAQSIICNAKISKLSAK